MAEFVREARKRVLVVVHELLLIELGGLARAGHPATNEAGLVVGEHHSVMHPGALGFALRATGASAHAVAVHVHRAAKARAAREALPEAHSAGEPFASAVPGEPHRRPGRARFVPFRARLAPAIPKCRLPASLMRIGTSS